jgi:uncharacterized membrane protein YqgA involved in biofilm formation
MFPGAGTVLNVTTILAGSAVGVLLGHRLPQRTRDVVTDGLGLVTLLIAALSAAAVLDRGLEEAVGDSAPVLIVLGALLVGGILGSLLRLEDRLEGVGVLLQGRLTGAGARRDGATHAGGSPAPAQARERFVEGFVSASLVFCIGPLTILGSLSDGLGDGIDQLALKSTLDGFAAIAFAASLGWGVAASALAVGVVQGLLTVLAVAIGGFVPEAHLTALTATGGLLLVGVAMRLLRLRSVPVADLLPALLVAPLLVETVVRLR